MYPDAGPSRTGPSYLPSKPLANGSGPSPRAGPSRWAEGDYDREERATNSNGNGNGFARGETSNRPYASPSPWSRSGLSPGPPRQHGLPFRSAPPHRSRTPSPPRRGYDRDRDRDREGGYDVRDRLSLEPGWRGNPSGRPNGSGPVARGNDPEMAPWQRRERRWEDRGDRPRERDDPARKGPHSTRPSPTQTQPPRFPAQFSPPSAPRGPRSLAGTPGPSRIPSGPRSVSGASSVPPWEERGRERPFSARDARPTTDQQRPPIYSRPGSPPRAPRSMRGSSSPVEVKRAYEGSGPATAPSQTVPLPLEIKTEAMDDLEEGEVLSPVRQTGWPADDHVSQPRRGDRWESGPSGPSRRGSYDRYRPGAGPHGPRKSLSPIKRARSRTPPWTRREGLDDGWAGRGRSRPRSNSSGRRRVSSAGPMRTEDQESRPASTDPAGRAEDVDEEVDRPPTPVEPPPSLLRRSESEERKKPVLSVEVASQEDNERRGGSVPPVTGGSAWSRPDTPGFPPPDSPLATLGQASGSNVDSVEVAADLPREQATVTGVDSKDVVMRSASPILEVESSTLEPAPASTSTGGSLLVGVADAPTHSSAQQLTDLHTIATTRSPGADVSTAGLRKNAPSPLAAHPTEGIEGDRPPSPPTPIAPTSPSESALTPGMLLPGQTADIEIVIDEQHTPLALPDESAKSPQVIEVEQAIPTTISLNDDVPPLPVLSPTTRKVTIAERRAVQLPPTNGSLSSPFGQTFPRRDSLPTADSMQESTDTEGEPLKTAETEVPRSPASEGALEEMKAAGLIAAVKAAQVKALELDVDGVLAWNKAAAPIESSRVTHLMDDEERDREIRKVSWNLGHQQQYIAQLVATTIRREQVELERHTRRLQAEYKELDDEWREHCAFLDKEMEKRGPPPADLYATPNAIPIIPIVTPGPVAPTTPSEDLFASRGNRRRGVGDAVATEAEFEAILAGLADTAAKDPNYRASKTTAVVPDMLLGKDRLARYDDENDLVQDPLAFYDYQGEAEPIWTDEERAIFVRRYLAYPKQFGRVADGLPDKTASDCVLYYYRTKKDVDYKGMLASRRGDKKKKSMPIKKSGKSSALLADLDRQKPTVGSTKPSMYNGRGSTPARGAKDDGGAGASASGRKGRSAAGARSEIVPNTPGLEAVRRRKSAMLGQDEEGLESSEGTGSRAGSEVPASGSKAKMRVTIKAPKRPRVSSISESMAPSGLLPRLTLDPTMVAEGGTVQPDLLPPVKRSGKRRKVAPPPAPLPPTDPSDPSGVVTPVDERVPGASSSRRNATNSYWSVDEKRRFRELVGVHGQNIKAIAADLPGKSERQVGNFFESHREDMRLDDVASGGEVARLSEGGGGLPPSLIGQGYQRSPERRYDHLPPTATATATSDYSSTYGRSIYSVYASQPARALEHGRYPTPQTAEPRLGMFPPSPHLAPPPLSMSSSGRLPSPPQPVSRSGGMRISALLNDDPPEPSRTNSDPLPPRQLAPPPSDAASDGTVDERDMDGMTRPSPRSNPPVLLAPQHPYARRPSAGPYDHPPPPRPDLDRFRSHSSSSFGYDSAHANSWPPQQQRDEYRHPPSHAAYYHSSSSSSTQGQPLGAGSMWDRQEARAPLHQHQHQQHAPAPPPPMGYFPGRDEWRGPGGYPAERGEADRDRERVRERDYAGLPPPLPSGERREDRR